MIKKYKNVIIGAVILILIFIGILINKNEQPSVFTPIAVNNDLVRTQVVIEVKGEVKKPGLYYLNSDQRVNDAIIQAGGFTNNANTDILNLAMKLADGMVIFVESRTNSSMTNKISINTSTIEQLMTIAGIGEAKARNIINYRNQNGRFKTLEEITNVSGISENLYQQIKEFICL